MKTWLARYVPRDAWLILLAEGWTFANDFVPWPMDGNHGTYSILMVKHG